MKTSERYRHSTAHSPAPPLVRRAERGSASVEFTLTFMVFLSVFMAVAALGVYGFRVAGAGLATELGARAAALCKDRTDEARVLARAQSVMQPFMADLSVEQLSLQWLPAGCTVNSSCVALKLGLSGASSDSGPGVTVGFPFEQVLPMPRILETTKRLEMPVDAAC